MHATPNSWGCELEPHVGYRDDFKKSTEKERHQTGEKESSKARKNLKEINTVAAEVSITFKMAKSKINQIRSTGSNPESLADMQRERKADLRNPTKVVIRKSIYLTYQMGRSKEKTQMNLSTYS